MNLKEFLPDINLTDALGFPISPVRSLISPTPSALAGIAHYPPGSRGAFPEGGADGAEVCSTDPAPHLADEASSRRGCTAVVPQKNERR